ncbi:MAG TPA: substrate-binding domain-containing protein [Steroidobacteraceae bacterium]|nr:substrate-binding domain-containing protein [Steroidobacteraceae bacterium]
MRTYPMMAAAAALTLAVLPAGALPGAVLPAAISPASTQSVSIPSWARYVAKLPPYRPSRQVSGTVTSWGHGFLKEMMRDWEEGFHRFQPNVRFQDDLASSAAAMAGLYTGRANLGVLAREIVPMEVAAYQKMTGQKVFPVTVLTGSYADPDKLMALGIFVNRDNPLARLDFRQLDAIFGAQHLGGAPANIRTWGQLGVRGAWKDRPIHPYSGPAGDEAPAFYFSQTVMHGSTLWNGRLQPLDDSAPPGGKHIDGYQRAVDAVATDPDGIAVTVAGYHNPRAKLVAVAITPAGSYIAPSRASVADRSYPLARSVTFYINDGPKVAPDPAVVEFLRYVLSRDGQEQALREGDFLPLTPRIARAQLAKLSDPVPPQAAGEQEDSNGGQPALELVRKIAVPQMTGTWDHLTVDPATDRLFLSAQDQQMVYVVPLTGSAAIRRITAGFDRPQGELYVPEVDRLVVTNGRSARVSLVDGHDLRPAATVTISAGADMIASDPAHGVLYVESGGTDSHRGPGWLALIDPRSGRLTGRVTTGYRAAALVLAQRSRRLFVAIPALDQVAVIDTDTRSIVSRWRVPGRPASMALDEASGRLFVATRTFSGDPRPPVLSVLDTANGRLLATLASKDATENMYWDPARRLIYTSSLDGYVQAYRERDANHYSLVATIRTVPHAGTSQLVPDLDELCVAAPPQAGQPAAVWVFRPVVAAMR